jgi:tetratricopeptide (TPR) repeat protein
MNSSHHHVLPGPLPRLLRFLFCLAFLPLPAAAQDGGSALTEIFTQANQAYESGEFREAARLYERALSENGPSFTLYYNLGNTYYRLEDLGRTILNYERARLLKPRQEDLAYNRQEVLTQAGAEVPPPGRWDFLLQTFTLNELALFSTLTFWGALLLAVWAVRTALRQRRFPYGILAGVMALVIIGILAVLSAIYLAQTRYSPQFAVVTAGESVNAHRQPAAASQAVARFAPGTQLFVLSTRGNWSYVELPDGSNAWIPREAVEPVLPPV